MSTEFIEFRLNIFCRHIATVAGVAVFRFISEIQEARLGAGIVRGVTILTGIGGDRVAGRMRPWVVPGAIPWFVRNPVGGILPPGRPMTGDADCRCCVIADEKLSVLIVMRIVARSALHLVIMVQLDFVSQCGGVFQLAICSDERIVVGKRNWMIIGKVSAEIARSAGHRGDSALHFDCGRTRCHHANRHCAIMTAEAKFRCSGRLPDSRLRSRAAVGRISYRRQCVIPEWRLPGAPMRCVAEVTDFRFHSGFDGAAAGN